LDSGSLSCVSHNRRAAGRNVCDPACGTCGFLVAVGESLRERHPEVLTNAKLRQHFHHGLFHGFDFDNTMLRIGSMNMLLHGVENPAVIYRDSLSQDHAGEEEKYTLVMANPPVSFSFLPPYSPRIAVARPGLSSLLCSARIWTKTVLRHSETLSIRPRSAYRKQLAFLFCWHSSCLG
jgi:hypothetical protein